MSIQRIAIIGTGLIGTSLGLALKRAGFSGSIIGWDANPDELRIARERGAIDDAAPYRESMLAAQTADVYVLATPVLPILDWMKQLAPHLNDTQLVTDTGSTKLEISVLAGELFNAPGRAAFLPGHPMAGKESGGATLADATLFEGARWLFTPLPGGGHALAKEWTAWIERIGAHLQDIDPVRHDEVCAWVSHLPQMLSTSLAALLEDTFAADAKGMAAVQAIGGRALRETTRLGASPYSMWRDIALTNTENIAATLQALEQRLAHLRENLRTPELRDEFRTANRFRKP